MDLLKRVARFFGQPAVIIVLVAAYVAVNLLRLGGDEFVHSLNDSVPAPLALAVTLLAMRQWHRLSPGSPSRPMWAGLAIGWAMWMVAEWWWAIAGLIGTEVPYPSGADAFWLGGYIPMYIALWLRSRSLPRQARGALRYGVLAAGLLFLAATIYLVILPVVEATDFNSPVESALNLLYPLMDLVLITLVLRMFFTYQQGRYREAWLWLSLGFALFSLGDLAFTYANNSNLYYPDGRANLLSTLGADIPYDLSYLACLTGLTRRRALDHLSGVIPGARVARHAIPNAHALVFLKADDTATAVSDNFAQLFAPRAPIGRTLRDVLGLGPDAGGDQLLAELKRGSPAAERLCEAETIAGLKQVLISGVPILEADGRYNGAIVLVRLESADARIDDRLSDYQRQIVRSLLEKTGSGQKEDSEISGVLRDYYQELLRALRRTLEVEGGGVMAQAYVEELRAACEENRWAIHVEDDGGLRLGSISASEVRSALPVLLERARLYTVRVGDESSMEAAEAEARGRLGETALRQVTALEALIKARAAEAL